MTAPVKSCVQDPIPPLASYEDLKKEEWYINVNREIRRLQWSLDGPLDKAVQVMRHAAYDPDDPPLNPSTAPEQTTTRLSLFEPKVSSVTIDVHCLAEWADVWSDMHLECDCLSFEDDPSDVDEEDDHSETRGGRGGYVTIRDFVTAAHLWLLGLRALILRAPRGDQLFNLDLLYEDPEPEPALQADTKLMVLVDGSLHSVGIDVLPESEWLIDSRTNPFPEQPCPPLPRRYTPPPPPDMTPVGGIDPSVERWNKERPPPRLLDAQVWPGV
ncbi:hypothetical protein PG997_002703 [Apiospora hydei]|uniref:Uncharacterized protein n=1 Tax=Apiospora hydei TaxID=1337664 RepID=A0ABR1WX56_9PEZI